MTNKPTETLLTAGSERLKTLARAIGFKEPEVQSVQQVFRTLSASWGDRPAGEAIAWPSDICDDHSPYELSVAIDSRGPQLRVLVEPMDSPCSLGANRTASRRLYPVLAREHHAHLERLHALEDLLVPEAPQGRFVLWYAAAFTPGQAPQFKVYFNLNVQGPGRAARLTEEALRRLGFAQAWPALAESLRRREDGADTPCFLALDLTHEAHARLKVYLRHLGASADFLEELSGLARHQQQVPGGIADFCRRMAGHDGPYHGKGPVTCFTFVDPSDARPASATCYFPISHHTRDDLESRQRIAHYLQSQQLEAAPYLLALESCARRPLEAGSSLHTYVALRHWHGGPRVTAYFSPELYGMQPPRTSRPRAAPLLPATAIVAHYEAHSMADHPFFARLRQEPVDLGKLARLLANFRVGITQHFTRRLAMLTAHVTDERLRCLLAKQLNDELGNGDFSRAHRGLFDRMLEVLAPWAPADLEAATAPGRALGAVLEHCYVKADPYEGLGASIVVELGGKQVDQLIADEFRRQRQIAPSALEWLHLHETLEVEHADESLDMARLIPEDGPALEAAWRGARTIASGARAFFDALYEECFA